MCKQLKNSVTENEIYNIIRTIILIQNYKIILKYWYIIKISCYLKFYSYIWDKNDYKLFHIFNKNYITT